MDSTGGDETILGLCSASRVGSEHRRVARNNQDAWAVRASGSRVVAVVCDGCSMGAASEVGAALGAAWLAQRVLSVGDVWRDEAATEAALAALSAELDQALWGWTGALGAPEQRAELVAQYFLFTFLCAVVEGDHATVFGVGDGVWADGARVRVIDAGPDNAPPYAGYRILPAEALERAAPDLTPRVHHRGPLAGPLFIGTDGVAPIAAELVTWLADEAVWRAPRALGRRLNLAEQRLVDDATVIAVRRAPRCA